ncbi:MAG: TraR/DksA family transcriptional regulator [Candidatus Omnitrophica bacterium]|nr:TraR/DksA family transcriptional regulator [Candidatus Omnitrophota bacterium]
MNKKDKKYYLELLNREKERIFKNLGYLKEGIGSGEKGIPTHIADYGTDEFEKGLDINLSDEERKILEKIDIAIEKLDKNTYGICESCGKKISSSRLKALPYARYCINCQRDKEKGGR